MLLHQCRCDYLRLLCCSLLLANMLSATAGFVSLCRVATCGLVAFMREHTPPVSAVGLQLADVL